MALILQSLGAQWLNLVHVAADEMLYVTQYSREPESVVA